VPERWLMSMVATQVIGDIALVVVASSVLGLVARRCGQPTVIGQILTGLLFGPSLLGRLPWHLTARLFPHAVLSPLNALAQVAIVIFMFAVGYEVDLGALRGHGRTVPWVASAALLVPMGLGMACVLVFRSGFAAIGQPHQGHSFVLFMGTAMSVTALPVLASLVRERELAGTMAGDIATAAAGIMDVLAWLVLAAALIGTGGATRLPWLVTLLLTAVFVTVMLLVVRPSLSWWLGRSRSILADPVPVAFALAMGSAWITASLGLQPVFGGFLAGLVMRPRHRAPDADVLRSMDRAGSLLLPLFFIVTGLSVSIGSVHGEALVLLALVFCVASGSKFGAAYTVSRACRLEPRQSATVAALVNTRGLTELIALNVGLQSGLIGQRLFTVLVLMAIATTLMTGPLLALIRPVRAARLAGPHALTEPRRQGAVWN